MSKSLATFAFVYAVAVALVCTWDADYLLRDAVVGLDVIVPLFWLLLSPIGIAGVLCIIFARVSNGVRIALAVVFGSLVGIATHLLTAWDQAEPAARSHSNDTVTVIAVYLATVAAYLTITFASQRLWPGPVPTRGVSPN